MTAPQLMSCVSMSLSSAFSALSMCSEVSFWIGMTDTGGRLSCIQR